eukprot:Rmarinus@m.25453
MNWIINSLEKLDAVASDRAAKTKGERSDPRSSTPSQAQSDSESDGEPPVIRQHKPGKPVAAPVSVRSPCPSPPPVPDDSPSLSWDEGSVSSAPTVQVATTVHRPVVSLDPAKKKVNSRKPHQKPSIDRRPRDIAGAAHATSSKSGPSSVTSSPLPSPRESRSPSPSNVSRSHSRSASPATLDPTDGSADLHSPLAPVRVGNTIPGLMVGPGDDSATAEEGAKSEEGKHASDHRVLSVNDSDSIGRSEEYSIVSPATERTPASGSEEPASTFGSEISRGNGVEEPIGTNDGGDGEAVVPKEESTAHTAHDSGDTAAIVTEDSAAYGSVEKENPSPVPLSHASQGTDNNDARNLAGLTAADLKKEVEDLRKRREMDETKMTHLRELVEKAERRLTTRETKLARLRSDLEAALGDSDRLRKEVQNRDLTIKNFADEAESLQAQIKDMKAARKKTATEKEDLDDEYQLLKAAFDQTEKEARKQKERLDEEKKKTASLRNELNRAQQQHQAALRESEKQVAEFQKELAAKEKAVKDQMFHSETQINEIATLKRQINELVEARDKLHSSVALVAGEHESAVQTLTAGQHVVSQTLDEERKSHAETRKKAAEREHALELEMADIGRRLAASERDSGERLAEIASLKARVREAEAHGLHEAKTAADARDEAEIAAAKAQKALEDLAKTQQLHAEKESRLQSQITALTSMISDIEEEKRELQKKADDLMQQPNEDRCIDLENRVKSLADALVSKQGMLEALQSDKNVLSIQLEAEKKRARQLENLLESSRQSASSSVDDDLEGGLAGLGVPGIRLRTGGASSSGHTFEELPTEISGVNPRFVRAAGAIDSLGITAGAFLRSHAYARVGFVLYILALHFWVFVVTSLFPVLTSPRADVMPDQV